MGRETRRVPANWDHPKDEDGFFRPMRKDSFIADTESYNTEIKEWYLQHTYFNRNFDKNKTEPPRIPNPNYYMPSGEWYQLFETTTEGTPLSPPFESKNDLISWLVDNKDDRGCVRTIEDSTWIVNQAPTNISELIKEFKSLENDSKRWEWVIKNKDSPGLRLSLDNDQTILAIDNINDEYDDDNYASFDNYTGYSDGVLDLLNVIGIEAEPC